jgi:hypothetical protein
LRALAGELIRLTPSGRDPERYHVEKDRIAAEIRRAAREADWTRPKPFAAPASARNRQDVQSGRLDWRPLSGDGRRGPPGAVLTLSPGIEAPADCRHCRRRRAAQSRRH